MKSTLTRTVVDGVYGTVMARLEAETAPNLMLLRYYSNVGRDVEAIPKTIFRPCVIERRKPLAPTAKRVG